MAPKRIPLRSRVRLPTPSTVTLDEPTRTYINSLIRALEQNSEDIYSALEALRTELTPNP